MYIIPKSSKKQLCTVHVLQWGFVVVSDGQPQLQLGGAPLFSRHGFGFRGLGAVVLRGCRAEGLGFFGVGGEAAEASLYDEFPKAKLLKSSSTRLL